MPKPDLGLPGTAHEQLWAHMVWGAMWAMVRHDGGTEPSDVRSEICRLTWTEADALEAIAAIVAAGKYDRVTAGLRALRKRRGQ